MLTSKLDFNLPDDRIACQPCEPRDHARLLVYRRDTNELTHQHICDLPSLGVMQPGDLMVFNQTKVLKARFDGVRARTGGACEGLFLHEDKPMIWQAMLGTRGKPSEGEFITLDDNTQLELLEKLGGGIWRMRLTGPDSTLDTLQRLGKTPLPPYIRKARQARGEGDNKNDFERYNTVLAKEDGSVAAPTAGLHFTPQLLDALAHHGIEKACLTLHVGMGTFAPVKANRITDHPMHNESWHADSQCLRAIARTREAGKSIWVVGTTSVRCLESLPLDWENHLEHGLSGNTDLLIHPGDDGETPWQFRFTDKLLTNFHLPRSTLLALVGAMPKMGMHNLHSIYQTAIRENYRFYSYGDAMLVV